MNRTAWRKTFGAAARSCRLAKRKPGTKDFGACMRAEIKKAKRGK